MRRTILPILLCALLPAAPPAKPLADRDLGLAKGSLSEAPAPPAYQAETSAPGAKPLPKRINRDYPPVIPHAVQDYLPITREANLCLDCHAIPGPKKKGEPTPVPASHYVDLRRAPGAAGKTVAGARHVCTACHVPRSDARPLVANAFRP